VEKTLRESGDRLSASTRSRVESALNALKESLKGTDVADIRRKMDDLQSASHVMAQELYQKAAQGGSSSGYSSGGSTAGSTQDNVVDADYRVVDDEGK